MKSDDNTPMGGEGGTVEADETYYGKNQLAPKSSMHIRNMNRIVSLVDRATGRSTSVVFNGSFSAEDIGRYLFTRVDRKSRLVTDDNRAYRRPGKQFAGHEWVNHTKDEYVRGDVTTNTVEGFFGIFKRGMRGIYQHCGQQHLHRYLAEFDFRYSNRSGKGIEDRERADLALQGIVGKRLMYRRTNEACAA